MGKRAKWQKGKEASGQGAIQESQTARKQCHCDLKQSNLKPDSQTTRALKRDDMAGQQTRQPAPRHFSDRLLEHFLDLIRKQLGEHLKQVILFGSRARGDYVAGSDYDLLTVVDKTSPEIKEIIYKAAGEFLFQYDAVFSVFPISEEEYQKKAYEPFLQNIRKEGINLEPK